MTRDRRILCRVMEETPPVVAASSFRILEEVGDTFFLDFVQQGHVVARIRVQHRTLEAVHDRLEHDVFECESKVVH